VLIRALNRSRCLPCRRAMYILATACDSSLMLDFAAPIDSPATTL